MRLWYLSRCVCRKTVTRRKCTRVQSYVRRLDPRVCTAVFGVGCEVTLAGRRWGWCVNNFQEAHFVMSSITIKLFCRIGPKIGRDTRGPGMFPLPDWNHFEAITSWLAQTNNTSEGKKNFCLLLELGCICPPPPLKHERLVMRKDEAFVNLHCWKHKKSSEDHDEFIF